MKITVLNGSPKGEISVTIQYVRYIQRQYPDHELKILNVSHDIRRIERDPASWQTIMDEVQSSDGVLWATPVYYFLVPSQLKRFIELCFERRTKEIFRNKYVAALVTSVHCFDHLAINYLTGISEDLEMRFVGGFTPEMEDLSISQERTNLVNFAAYFFDTIKTGAATIRNYAPLNHDMEAYRPAAIPSTPKTGNQKIVMLTDENDPGSNLGRMMDVFQRSLPSPVDVININTVDIKGGCLGCIHCGYDNTCAYQDGYKQFVEENLIPAEAIIFAGTVKDRYLSSNWKRFFDRSFVFGHTPFLGGKQIGFILSGPLRQLGGLRELFEGYIQFQRCSLNGFATDEDSAEVVTEALHTLAAKLIWALEHDLKAPSTFLGAGAHLLLQNFIRKSRGIFRADHRYYKQHGLYDAGNDFRHEAMNAILAVVNLVPPMRREFQKKMKPGMIAGLKKIVES
jgi:multimeric flavodoxin WrbA